MGEGGGVRRGEGGACEKNWEGVEPDTHALRKFSASVQFETSNV